MSDGIRREPYLFLVSVLTCILANGEIDLGSAFAASPCNPMNIRTDVSKWNSGFFVYGGHSRGETFVAADTLIQSITVWRYYSQPDTNFTPMHLFITEVDSTGYPVPWQILLDGPVVVAPYFDGVHPLPIKFNLNPPFALPHPGRYFFAVKENLCLGFFTLLSDTTDPYPDGQCFVTSPNYACEGLGGSAGISDRFADLIFDIEFCEPTVPTKRPTWGLLKATYR